MRRFGLHAVVALAGAVACSRFGADTSEAAPATSADGGGGAVGDGGDAAGATTDGGPTVTGRFCDQHPKALFCADFEEEGAPKWDGLIAPADNPKLEHSIATAPNGRRGLRMHATDVTTVFEAEGDAFQLAIPSTLTSAKLDLEVMCETSSFQFARLAGFVFVGKDVRNETSINAFGYPGAETDNLGFDSADDGKKLLVVADRTWAHATIALRRSNQELLVEHSIDGTPLRAGIKLGVKGSDAQLFLTFGVYENSTENSPNITVWFDDVVLNEP